MVITLDKEAQDKIKDFYKSCGNKTPAQMHTYADTKLCHVGQVKGCTFYKVREGIPVCSRGWCLAK